MVITALFAGGMQKDDLRYTAQPDITLPIFGTYDGNDLNKFIYTVNSCKDPCDVSLVDKQPVRETALQGNALFRNSIALSVFEAFEEIIWWLQRGNRRVRDISGQYNFMLHWSLGCQKRVKKSRKSERRNHTVSGDSRRTKSNAEKSFSGAESFFAIVQRCIADRFHRQSRHKESGDWSNAVGQPS